MDSLGKECCIESAYKNNKHGTCEGVRQIFLFRTKLNSTTVHRKTGGVTVTLIMPPFSSSYGRLLSRKQQDWRPSECTRKKCKVKLHLASLKNM